MEAFFEGLGIAALVILALTGLAAGLAVGKLTGRSLAAYGLIGAAAAVATPFVLAALGVTLLAAGGVLLVLVVGLVGALAVLALARVLMRKS